LVKLTKWPGNGTIYSPAIKHGNEKIPKTGNLYKWENISINIFDCHGVHLQNSAACVYRQTPNPGQNGLFREKKRRTCCLCCSLKGWVAGMSDLLVAIGRNCPCWNVSHFHL
jgi:hypothetical protein